MILNTNVSCALKNYYGQYTVKDLSLFEIEKMNVEFPLVEIKVVKGKDIKLKIKCPICSEYHYYNYSINEFLHRNMVIGGCERLGIPVFFIGKKQEVEQKIKKYNEISNDLYAMI